jgi:DNA primase
MAFDPRFLDELRERVNLAELIGRRVRLTRRGRDFVGLCPFHQEKTGSFNVVPDKSFFHCFGCGAHGDAIGWLMRIDGLAFPEAVETLAKEVGMEVPVSTPEERVRAQRQATLYGVLEATATWFESELRSARGRPGLDYLRRRGYDDDIIARWRLGWAPDSRTALRAAVIKTKDGAKIEDSQLVEAGLLIAPEGGGVPYDRFRGRVIFPITDARGRIIAFGGRILEERDGVAKYLNSPDTPLFHKGRVLYGLAQAREAASSSGRICVVEGYTDVIAMARAGVAAVAPLGTALTESHLELLWKVANEPILCFDGDSAGRRAAARALERGLPLLQPGKSLRFAMLQGGEDPDSLLRKEGATAIEAVLAGAIPLDRMVWDIETESVRLDTPERIAGVKKALEDRARSIADRSVQEQYLTALRQRLNDTVWGVRRAAARGHRPPPKPQPAGEGARRGVRSLDRRREQLLLFTLLNHPDLLEEFGETIGMIELFDRNLERLRGEILRVWQQNSALDSSLLRLHLRATGVAETLAVLEGPEVRLHAEFARAGAPREGARRGLIGLLAPFRQRDWRAQLDEAQRAWREDQTEANWARMQGLIEASQRAEAEIAAVDDEFASFGGAPPGR